MTNTADQTKSEIADRIASEHGCDLQPDPFGGTTIVVQPYHSQGSPLDDARISECRDALKAAGVAPWERRPGAAPAIDGTAQVTPVALPGKVQLWSKK